MRAEPRPARQQGFTLLEVLIALLILGIVGMGLAGNTIASLQIVKKTTTNYQASNLALSKIEELSACNPTMLGPSFNSVEPHVSSPGTPMTFTRTTTVTINTADQSRTVNVVVRSNSSAMPTTAKFTTTFALWQ